MNNPNQCSCEKSQAGQLASNQTNTANNSWLSVEDITTNGETSRVELLQIRSKPTWSSKTRLMSINAGMTGNNQDSKTSRTSEVCCGFGKTDKDGEELTSRTGLVRMDMASFQPSRTIATMAHRGGSLLLAALLASCVLIACKGNRSRGNWTQYNRRRCCVSMQSQLLAALLACTKDSKAG